MIELFTLENFGTLLMLCFLQALLGFFNLLYISIESQRAQVAHQKSVRFWGIILAVALRVVLLFVMIHLIDALAEPFHIFTLTGILEGGVNFATCVFLIGGVFIIYTEVKEISHMLTIEHLSGDGAYKPGKSAVQVVIMIVLMNLIFSFDYVLSALAITDVFAVLATAIILSGLAMLWLADGVVLLGKAGPAAAHAIHENSLTLKLFGYEVVPMSKTIFYFSVLILVGVEVIQSGYRRKLNSQRLNETQR